MKKSLIYEEEFDVSYDNDLKCSTFISLYHNCLWRFMSFSCFEIITEEGCFAMNFKWLLSCEIPIFILILQSVC